MKKFRQFLALALTLCMCFGYASTASAETTKDEKETVSTESTASTRSADYPVEDNYNNVWLNKGTYIGQSFRVHNTNSGRVGITFQVESSSNSSYADIYVTAPNGLTVLVPATYITPVTSKDKREFILTNAIPGYYTIHYNANAVQGMRINCWMYKWYD